MAIPISAGQKVRTFGGTLSSDTLERRNVACLRPRPRAMLILGGPVAARLPFLSVEAGDGLRSNTCWPC